MPLLNCVLSDLAATYNTKPWQLALSKQVSDALQMRQEWLGIEWIKPGETTGQTSSETPSETPGESSSETPGESSIETPGESSIETPGEREVRLLDYACGTGSITTALGSSVTQIRGIDVSEAMVERYNEAARSAGLSPEKAEAVVGDLCGPGTWTTGYTGDAKLGGAEFYNFDIAVVALGFHHFEDPARAIKRLGERLKPRTGVLVIVDFLPFTPNHENAAGHEHGSSNEHGTSTAEHSIKHHGFTGDQMREFYQKAGLENFDIVALKQPAVMELASGTQHRTIFIAKGRRASTRWQRFSAWVGDWQNSAGGQVNWGPDNSEWNHGSSKEDRPGNKWGQQFTTDDRKWNHGSRREEGPPKKQWTGF